MRCAERLLRPCYYATFHAKEPILDRDGNKTGQDEVVYNPPERFLANVSSAKGESYVRQFGEDVTYDRVLITDDPTLPIDEVSVLWVDIDPQIEPFGGRALAPHDYIVKRVAKSENFISLAIRKVNIR